MEKAIRETSPMLRERWGDETAQEIADSACKKLDRMRSENASDPRAVRKHTESDIFPCIGLYEAMQEHGISKEDALEFLDRSWSLRAEKGARRMKSMLRWFGLYRRYPAMFGKVARKSFGTDAGFEATFYDCGKDRCRFDMTKCLFLDTCTRYGCPELTQCFCHVDDVNNADLHPKLRWNRTQYMGGGGEFCDFDISLEEERKERGPRSS